MYSNARCHRLLFAIHLDRPIYDWHCCYGIGRDLDLCASERYIVLNGIQRMICLPERLYWYIYIIYSKKHVRCTR